MKLVLDTNTIVSALGWDGPPAVILLALRRGQHRLVTTHALLTELTRVLAYPRLHTVASHPALPDVLAWLHRAEHVVVPQERLGVIAADPADDRVLEAAVAGHADRVISGDRHLLALREFRGIPIVTARQFLDPPPS